MIKIWHLLVLVVAIIVGLSFYFDDNYLTARQNTMQWQIGDPAVNTLVSRHIGPTGRNYYILTNYPWLKYLPGLDGRCEMLDMSNDREFFKFIRMPYVTNILLTDADIPKDVMRFIRIKLDSGEYKIIGAADGYFLLQVK